MDNSDHFSGELFDRFINAQDISILRFAVGGYGAFDIAVIDRIVHFPVFRMVTAERPVDSDRYNIADLDLLLRFSIPRHLRLSFFQRFPPGLNAVLKEEDRYKQDDRGNDERIIIVSACMNVSACEPVFLSDVGIPGV